jgi:hypothetical protein
MRAELVIEHKSGDVLGALASAFGAHDPAVLQNSTFARKSPGTARSLAYAGIGPELVVLAWPTQAELVLFVESSGGQLRKAAAKVWDVFRKEEPALGPKLKSVILFDEDANDTVVEANVGVFANLRRPELLFTLGTGILSAIWLPIALAAFESTGDLVLGAIPALLAAILALVMLVFDVRTQSLVWK